MHGGISPDLTSLEQIKAVKRPLEVGDTGIMCDILWSDPDDDVEGWDENERGVSYVFGPKIVTKFLKKHDLDLICRAHQVSVIPNTKLISFRWSKMDMNSSPNDSLLRYFQRRTTVTSSITLVLWWVSTRIWCVPFRYWSRKTFDYVLIFLFFTLFILIGFFTNFKYSKSEFWRIIILIFKHISI